MVATTYNDCNEIERYLESICSQSILPKEIVIADGGSRDNTVEIIRKFDSYGVTIKVLKKGRLSISEGYNLAIKKAASELIGVTGVGNLYENTYFEKLLNGIKNSDIAYSPIRGKITNNFSEKYCNTFLNGDEGQKQTIASNHGALVRKKVFEDLGYFYERFIYAGEDTEFYLLVRENGYKTVRVDEARVWWLVPENMSQYCKQVKNYSIAGLQLQSNKGILKKILITFYPIVGFLLLEFVKWWLGFVFLIVWGMYFFGDFIKFENNKRDLILYFLSKMLPGYYSIRYLKYANTRYKVNRNGETKDE